MLGYSAEELTGSPIRDITPEKWHADGKDIVESQVLTNGYSAVYEKEYIRKDGTIFPVELRTVMLKDDNGKPIGFGQLSAISPSASNRKKRLKNQKKHIA